MTESPPDNLTFEQALGALEQTVRELEDGQLGLEAALGSYERGIALLKRCYAQLREAEQKIQLLTGMGPEGRPVTQPFEPPAAADGKKADGSPRRKKSDGQPDVPF